MRACIGTRLKPFRSAFVASSIAFVSFVSGCGSDVGDLFAIGGAGGLSGVGNGTTGAGPGAGPGATDASTTAAAQSSNAAPASNDASAASTADAASSADAASATATATDQASSSTGMPDPTIFCGQDACDIPGETCCLFGPTNGLTCKAQCDFLEKPIHCDGPSDCNGEVCCGTLDGLQQSYEHVECTNSCNSDNERVFCETTADCDQDQECLQSNVLPMGYLVCRTPQ